MQRFMHLHCHLSLLVSTCTCGGIHAGRVEPASLKVIIFIYDVSWADSAPRSPVPVSLHSLASQLKISLPGLIAPEHPLFTFGPSF